MRANETKPGRRKLAPRWTAVLAVAGGLIALVVWIALGTPGIGDEPPTAPETSSGPTDTPDAAVDTYLAGLAAGDYDALRSVLADPDFATRSGHDWWFDLMDMATVDFVAEPAQQYDVVAVAPFAANLRFITGDVWAYTGTVNLIEEEGRWLVDWSPAVLHPTLGARDAIRATMIWQERGRILAHDGTPLTDDRPVVMVGVVPERIEDIDVVAETLMEQLGVDPAAVPTAVKAPGVQPDWFLPMTTVRPARFREVKLQLQPVAGIVFRETTARLSPKQGFASHVLGRVGEVTAERLDELGPPYERGDEVGLSGLERAFETHLAGSPVVEVVLANQFSTPVEVLFRSDGRSAQDLVTTMEPAVQRAVERALDGAPTPSAIVVLDAASGEIRGVGSRPLAEFNRAFGARYPPGSTFKIVTAAALLHAGFDTDTSVSCPAEITVGNRTVHNAGAASLGGTTLGEAFAHSCNTTFAPLGADLDTGDLVAAAERFGFNSPYELPLPVTGGQFPAPESTTEQGAAAIGQARVLASPLHMATVAAAAATGEWLQPSLLADQTPLGTSLGIDAEALQAMMRAVVDHGTGTAADVEGEPVHGKTGSAEFGEEDPAPTHAWFIGYRGELAFAVFIEAGGAGGTVAAPVAAALMTAIDEERQATSTLASCDMGSWPTFQGTGERTGCSSTAPIEDPRITWGTFVGIQGWLNNPVVSGDLVYTGSAGSLRGHPDDADGVYAVRLDNGSVAWTHPAGNDVNGVAVAGDLVIATADEGVVWALDAGNGSVAWVFPVDETVVGPLYTNPLIVDDLAVVGSAAGVLYALDMETGEARWSAQLDSSIRGGAATDGEAIYVVGEAGDARAFSLEGHELWRRALTFDSVTGDTLTARVFAAPTVVGDLVVVPYIRDTSYDEPAMVALDKYIGSIRWEASDPGSVLGGWGNLRSSPAVVGGELVFADPTFAGIVGVDAQDGTASWALDGGALCHAQWSSPAWSGATIVVPQHDGGLYAFDIAAGELSWSLYLGAAAIDGAFPATINQCLDETSIQASPAIAPDGSIIVGTAEGFLVRIDKGA